MATARIGEMLGLFMNFVLSVESFQKAKTFYGKVINVGLKTTALEIMRVWGAECRFFLFTKRDRQQKHQCFLSAVFFMSFTKFLVSFACHIAKPSLRALNKQKTQVDRSLWSKSAKKTTKKKKTQKKQQIEKLLTISVVFPSCDQIQPMDGLFYTKDEVAPYCSPEDRDCFSFLLFFLKFYLTYMAGPVLTLLFV